MDVVFSSEELDEDKDLVPTIPWLGFHQEPSAPLESFDHCLVQRGWPASSLHKLQCGDIGDLDKSTIVPMLQSWFCFGLIDCSHGVPLSIDEIVVAARIRPISDDGPLAEDAERT